jgi:hypothetical protein
MQLPHGDRAGGQRLRARNQGDAGMVIDHVRPAIEAVEARRHIACPHANADGAPIRTFI